MRPEFCRVIQGMCSSVILKGSALKPYRCGENAKRLSELNECPKMEVKGA